MLKNWLPEQSRQRKGDSSASMVEPQEHNRKGPGAQTSEDTGGSKRRIRRDMVYSRGERKEYRP
jgi:hypothetical protein